MRALAAPCTLSVLLLLLRQFRHLPNSKSAVVAWEIAGLGSESLLLVLTAWQGWSSRGS